MQKFASLHICAFTNEQASWVMYELICSFPHCVLQFHPVTDGEETEMCGGLGPDWWLGMIFGGMVAVLIQTRPKRREETTKQPAGKPQFHLKRE